MAGPSDVDSGPLPLGVSLSATVVTLGAAQVEGDSALANALADYGEFMGLPVDTPWTKRYVLGLAPIGDAFLVWSKTARPWVSTPPDPPQATVDWIWRVPLLMLLFAVGVVPWLPRLLRLARRVPSDSARDRFDQGTASGTSAARRATGDEVPSRSNSAGSGRASQLHAAEADAAPSHVSKVQQ
jgi:hypothetical protein